jgi:hypothetical protein
MAAQTGGMPEILDDIFVTPGKPDWGMAVTGDFRTLSMTSSRIGWTP